MLYFQTFGFEAEKIQTQWDNADVDWFVNCM